MSLKNQPGNKKNPRPISPTPLRDWVNRQPPARKAGYVVLFAILLACGGKASVVLAFTPVPMTQQLLFALLAGVLLGSRLGCVSATLYLLAATIAGGPLWPAGMGSTALTGPFGGYLWSLPATAYLAGFVVERLRMESAASFAIGVTAGIGAYEAIGCLRLLGAGDLGVGEAVVKGAGFLIGQHAAHGALAVLIGSSTSAALHARE